MHSEVRNATMVGVVLMALAAVILLSFMVFSIVKSTVNEGAVKNQDATMNFVNAYLDDYNDVVVMGRDVISLLEKNDELSIFVNTKRMEIGKPVSYTNDLNVQCCNGRPYVNYGTLMSLSGGETETLQTVPANTNVSNFEDTFLVEEGVIFTEGYYCLSNIGMLVQNNDFGNCRKSGAIEYIDVNSKFDSYLIKDLSGVVVGVLFSQVMN